MKALSGRGRKRAVWVEYLHAVLREELDRFSSAGVQMSRSLLQYITVSLLQQDESPFGAEELDPSSNTPIASHVTVKWIDSFLNRFNIVIRKQSGCLTRYIAHTAYIEKHVSYHLGRWKVLFEDGTLDENYEENMDETHFVFNMDNYRTLGARSVDSLNYADVAGGADDLLWYCVYAEDRMQDRKLLSSS